MRYWERGVSFFFFSVEPSFGVSAAALAPRDAGVFGAFRVAFGVFARAASPRWPVPSSASGSGAALARFVRRPRGSSGSSSGAGSGAALARFARRAGAGAGAASASASLAGVSPPLLSFPFPLGVAPAAPPAAPPPLR